MAWREGVGEVGAGDLGPARLQLHPDGAAPERGGLHQGGADAAQWVGDQLAGCGVLSHDAAGQLRAILAGWAVEAGR
jgi:hypothetical protein